MRILITGGAGFIGSAVCRHLVGELRLSVVNVDKLTYASTLTSLASIESDPLYSFVKADICDRSAMDDVFCRFEPDAVIHLAAESHVDRSINAPRVFLDTNIIGTAILLEAGRAYLEGSGRTKRDTFRFLHVSTDEVYGSLEAKGRFTEKTAYDPSSPYSASKAAADHIARAWQRTYDMPIIISNCSNNYGPFQFPEKLIPLTILNALEGKPLPVYGDGSNVRDWLYVDDHARALAMVIFKGRIGEKYNVGGSSERSNIQVVRQICELMNRLSPAGAPHDRWITFVADRPGHDQRYAIDSTKAQKELGWRALENFETGIEKTVRWYLDRRDWWEPIRSGLYAGDRLGLLKTSGTR